MKRLVLCVLLVAATLGISLVPPLAAHAEGEVTITFETFSPVLLNLDDPTQVVTLTGTVRNDTRDPLTAINVHF